MHGKGKVVVIKDAEYGWYQVQPLVSPLLIDTFKAGCSRYGWYVGLLVMGIANG